MVARHLICLLRAGIARPYNDNFTDFATKTIDITAEKV